MTSGIEMSRLMAQMQSMQAQASQGAQQPSGFQDVPSTGDDLKGIQGTPSSQQAPDFSAMLQDAISTVNDYQQQSGDLKTAFQKGDPNVSITEVMVASQKSHVAFTAMTEVRNKVVEAYKSVKNMQI